MDVDRFVTRTRELIKKEREAEIEETRILQEGLPGKYLERRGVGILKLTISGRHAGLYGRTVVTFESTKEMPSHSITPGDIVGLSLSQESSSQHDLISSGVVSKVNQSAINVAFDESHELIDLDDGALYKLVKLANDVTYRRLQKTLDELKSNSSASSPLVNRLFGGAVFTSPRSVTDPQPIEFINSCLDDSQREAVRFALGDGREVAIVHGPPGTGKTTTVVEIIRQAVLRGLKVLACAPSNIAVDNLVERLSEEGSSGGRGVKLVRLGHPARVLPSTQLHSLDAILSNSEETKLVEDVRRDINRVLVEMKRCRGSGERQRCRDDIKSLRKELRAREETAVRDIMSRASVVLATLTMATADGPIGSLDTGARPFDLVVIDECSQALEIACWIALLRGKKCVLAGDHHQLPPTIISTQAAKEGLSVTLMERLLLEVNNREQGSGSVSRELKQEQQQTSQQLQQEGQQQLKESSELVRMLTMQYRMHETIMRWSSVQMYEGKLVAHQSVAQHLLKDIEGVEENEETCLPMLLIDTAGCDLEELELPDGFSKANEGEADIAAEHVHRLIASGVASEDIAVIAPYNLQVEILRLRLSKHYPRLEIRSVDGFQGREKEAVVISLVRSNKRGELGFLTEDRRINVAVTRARRHVTVVCDTDTVCRHWFLQSLVEHMTSCGGEVRSAQQYIQEGVISGGTEWSEDLKERLSVAVESSSATNNTTKKSQSLSAGLKKSRPVESGSGGGKIKSSNKSTRDPGVTHKSYSSDGKSEKQEVKSDGATDSERELEQVLAEFQADSSRTTHSFPTTLTSRERFLVHEISERVGLLHISSGEGEQRFIEVRKQTAAAAAAARTAAAAKTAIYAAAATGTAAAITSTTATGTTTRPAATADHIAATADHTAATADHTAATAAATSPKSLKSMAQASNKTVKVQSVSLDSKPTSQSASSITKQEVEPASDADQSCSSFETERAETADKLPCERCGKLVPTANLALHTSRCGSAKQQQQQNASTSSSSNGVTKSSNKNKNKPSSDAASLPSSATSNAGAASLNDDDEFNALVTAAAKANSRCHMTKCRASVVTLGQECAFCKQRFCLSHHLAEAHGCGDKAKEAARRSLVREGAMWPGSGVPSKKPDPIKRAHLERRLDKRIGKMEENRKKKTTDGGSKK